jgi:enolase
MGESLPHAEEGLSDAGHNTNVGDEGGFAPNLASTGDEALGFIMKSIEKAGYKPGEDVCWRSTAPRPSSSRTASTRWKARASRCRSRSMVDYLAELCGRYPIVSIEDGMAEDDWEGWKR